MSIPVVLDCSGRTPGREPTKLGSNETVLQLSVLQEPAWAAWDLGKAPIFWFEGGEEGRNQQQQQQNMAGLKTKIKTCIGVGWGDPVLPVLLGWPQALCATHSQMLHFSLQTACASSAPFASV